MLHQGPKGGIGLTQQICCQRKQGNGKKDQKNTGQLFFQAALLCAAQNFPGTAEDVPFPEKEIQEWET